MLTKRPAAAEDYDFLYTLHKAAMKDSVSLTWGWDEAWQQNYFRAKFDPARRQILLWRGKPVGTISVQEEEEELYLALIEILPEFQGRGLGTAVIQNLIHQAQQTGKTFTLHVLKTNPDAQKLYKRLGLKVIAEEEFKLKMQLASRPTPD